MAIHSVLLLLSASALALYSVTCLRMLSFLQMGKEPAAALCAAKGLGGPLGRSGPELVRGFLIQDAFESLPLFLPALWCFALLGQGSMLNDCIAASLGVLWNLGRVVFLTDPRAPRSKGLGAWMQTLATGALLVGCLFSALGSIAPCG